VSVKSNTSKTHGHLIRAAGLMGLLTLASRVLGMLRDIVNARAFGTGWHWDAFIYAFMVPNFFRRLVGEGALASAFIPVYSETLQKRGTPEAFRFANIILTALAAGFLVLLLAVETILGVLLRMDSLPPSLVLMLDLMRFFFPHLALVSIFALGMGVLNSHRHFFAPALAPALFNGAWIFGVFWVTRGGISDFPQALRGLAAVILASGFLQLAVECPFLFRLGYRPRLIWELGYPPLKKSVRLLFPVILGFAVVQINLLVDMTLAFLIGPGANSNLWYGGRLMQFPLGLFAITLGTALLPTISHQISGGRIDEARKSLSFTLRSIFFIILPCSAGLIALKTPIVRMLFEHGEFDAQSTARTAAVLMGYTVGLFAYSGHKIIVSGFYAVQDTLTPVRIAVISLVTNVVANFILMIPFKEAGLAMATSLAGILQFVLLVVFFHRKIVSLDMGEIARAVGKITVATLVMAATAVAAHYFLMALIPGEGSMSQMIRVSSSIVLSIVVYLVCCGVLRITEMSEIFRLAFKRRSP